jgi:hypothetical protein
MNDCGLSGSIPETLSDLPKLQSIDVSNNALTGSLYRLWMLSDVVFIDASNNLFNDIGDVPDAMEQLLSV